MSLRQVTLHLNVEYDPDKTSPEGLCSAYDMLLDTAKSTPGILDEYGDPTEQTFTYDERTDRDADDAEETEELAEHKPESTPIELTGLLQIHPRLIDCRFLLFFTQALRAQAEIVSGAYKPTIEYLRSRQPVSLQEVKILEEKGLQQKVDEMNRHIQMMNETAENIAKENVTAEATLNESIVELAKVKLKTEQTAEPHGRYVHSSAELVCPECKGKDGLCYRKYGSKASSGWVCGHEDYDEEDPVVSSPDNPCGLCEEEDGDCVLYDPHGEWDCAESVENEPRGEEGGLDEDEEEDESEEEDDDTQPDKPKVLEDAMKRAKANVKACKKLKGKKARVLVLSFIELGCMRTYIDPTALRCEELREKYAGNPFTMPFKYALKDPHHPVVRSLCPSCSAYHRMKLDLPNWPKRKA